MRPVRRGMSPRAEDYGRYGEAKSELIARLGSYCSYCERRIASALEVEHIQPKSLPQYAALEGRWENFLLACRNCNGTKLAKNVVLAENLLPDRDNTFAAYTYTADGRVTVAAGMTLEERRMAEASLELTGLGKRPGRPGTDDRVWDRIQAWGIAKRTRERIVSRPGVGELRDAAVDVAVQCGFFSVWMAVFAGDADMRNRLIDAFAGTRGSECFAAGTTEPVRPAPNPDGLADGGKV